MVQEIEQASKGQESRIIQINFTISSLDKQTQENANVASVVNNSAKQIDKISDSIEQEVTTKRF